MRIPTQSRHAVAGARLELETAPTVQRLLLALHHHPHPVRTQGGQIDAHPLQRFEAHDVAPFVGATQGQAHRDARRGQVEGVGVRAPRLRQVDRLRVQAKQPLGVVGKPARQVQVASDLRHVLVHPPLLQPGQRATAGQPLAAAGCLDHSQPFPVGLPPGEVGQGRRIARRGHRRERRREVWHRLGVGEVAGLPQGETGAGVGRIEGAVQVEGQRRQTAHPVVDLDEVQIGLQIGLLIGDTQVAVSVAELPEERSAERMVAALELAVVPQRFPELGERAVQQVVGNALAAQRHTRQRRLQFAQERQAALDRVATLHRPAVGVDDQREVQVQGIEARLPMALHKGVHEQLTGLRKGQVEAVDLALRVAVQVPAHRLVIRGVALDDPLELRHPRVEGRDTHQIPMHHHPKAKPVRDAEERHRRGAGGVVGVHDIVGIRTP